MQGLWFLVVFALSTPSGLVQGQPQRAKLCAEEVVEELDCTIIRDVDAYRTFTGRCNNLRHPNRGASRTPMVRLLKPTYEDNQEAPIGFFSTVFYDGVRKPNARRVSKQIMAANFTLTHQRLNAMLVHFGQFVAHDITLARESEINCTLFPRDSRSCYNLVLPRSDQTIRHTNILPFQRSVSCYHDIGGDFYREQINHNTAYLDASMVYGSDPNIARLLRDFTNDQGLMRTNRVYRSATGKAYLPFDDPDARYAQCLRNKDVNGIDCFVAGDVRVNEQLLLSTLHTIFVREHNRIAGRLGRMNQHWSSDRIFSEARKILIGITQKITFDDWLPKLIGAEANSLRDYPGYDVDSDPSIANSFAVAVMRFGHAMMVPVLERYDSRYRSVRGGHIPLREAFFAPEILMFDGGIDPLIRGAIFAPAKEIMGRSLVNSELTEHLFPHARAFPSDLASLNIQRGRDHAIQSYNEYRKFCGLPKIDSWVAFGQIIRDPEIISELIPLYSVPTNIDLWVGGLLESPVGGAILGPTFTCLLVHQFRRLRDGDRFWYEQRQVFNSRQLATIKSYTLARILCNTGDAIDSVQEDAFLQDHRLKRCETLPDLNLDAWKERPFQRDDPPEEKTTPMRKPLEKPFECDSPACACRYKAGQWSSCDATRRIRTRIDKLELQALSSNGTCPTQRQLFRSCVVDGPRTIREGDERFFNEFLFRVLANKRA